ncbi:TIM21-domain-containing protein [Zychaea mexicana]|uniref:TIM21-domain-containing protein n=1 Tax=Zychaea mexicana TaxID=64656 RepID=UPI0022FF3C67|nr:TIM21-domain-containing protein [Zychaea mexicana]KAI9485142.1 TIM21-domain-containing protein [Zychaea mexicana]
MDKSSCAKLKIYLISVVLFPKSQVPAASRAFVRRPALRATTHNTNPTSSCRRLYATANNNNKTAQRSSLISRQTAKEWKELSTPQKVVAASKVTVDLGVILTGLALTSVLLYFVGSELFGSDSTTAIFSDAVDRIRVHPELSELLGAPIKGHGEPSRNRMKRNRRIHHQIVNDAQGNPHLFMRFYVEGPNGEGTAMLEMIKDDKGSWQYKQLFCDVPGQGYPSRRYFVEDNRS